MALTAAAAVAGARPVRHGRSHGLGGCGDGDDRRRGDGRGHRGRGVGGFVGGVVLGRCVG
ncbi:MAG: hypothetical protein R2713_10075 [Ilumatobacteraceae bacterium]